MIIHLEIVLLQGSVFLYKEIALSATNHFINKGVIDESKRVVYQYGFEVLFSTLVYSFIFVATALISETLIKSVVFWLGFFIIRKTSGGYHCNTYFSCHLLFLVNHLLFIVVIKTIPYSFISTLSIILFVLSFVFILIFAPVDNYNKPFIKTERKRFRKMSIVYAIVLLIFCVTNSIVLHLDTIAICLSIGSFSAAVSLIAGKIQIHRKEPS